MKEEKLQVNIEKELYEDAAYRLLKSLKCGMEISSVY